MNISNIGMLNEIKKNAEIASKGNFDIPEKNNVEFSEIFKSMLNDVNNSNMIASSLKNKFVEGDPSVSLVDTKIASELASLKTTFLTSSVQKALRAYKEIINMPL